MQYQPPYTITAEILNRVTAISEAVGRLTVLTDQGRALQLRRINRVRTIHGSLAIEGNTLSEAQITVFCEDDQVDAVVAIFRQLIRTTHRETGWLYVTPIEQSSPPGAAVS